MKPLHPEVTWKVPALFANDNVAIRLARELADDGGQPPFQIVYGAPACAWAGGRPPRVRRELSEAELRAYFGAYQELGIRCALTFTHPRAGERADDAYSNLLLKLLAEYDGQAIVADGALARYIRAAQPSVPLICSNNVPVIAYWHDFDGAGSELAYYRRLLETYDEVVLRTEAVLEGGIIDELGDIAGQCEVLVNQICARCCEFAPEHIAAQVGIIDRGEHKARGCIFYERRGPKEFERRGTTYVTPERRDLLIAHGLTKWKLGRRTIGAQGFAKMTLGAIYGEKQAREAMMARGAVSRDLWELLLSDPADPEILTRLP